MSKQLCLLIFRDLSLLFARLLMNSLVPALSQRVDDGEDEVKNHSYHEHLKDFLQEVSLVLLGLAAMQFFFLVCEKSLERLLKLSTNDGNESYQINGLVD